MLDRVSEIIMTHPTPANAGFALATSPGAIIGGKYRVQRIIGRGGMGVVLSASHVELAQEVAIKLLLPDATQDAEGVTRFLREGKNAARFTSPHITKVYDVGRLHTGEPFLVMEFLRGRDLKNIVERNGPQPPEVVMNWMLEAAEGLAEAHALGIVHRDVKPGNLFLAETAGGRHMIKLLDFGISKQTHAGEADLTGTSSTMGSPRYMAPEQMKSPKGVDHRVDIWGLGTILYELTTGRPPFTGASLTEVVVEVLHKEPPSPMSLRPTLPRPLNDVILRCLEKNPDARIQTAADFARALRAVLAGSQEPLAGLAGQTAMSGRAMAPSLSESFRGSPTSTDAVSGATIRAWDTTAGSPSPRRGVLVTALAALALVAGVGIGVGLYLWKGADPASDRSHDVPGPTLPSANKGTNASAVAASGVDVSPTPVPSVTSSAIDTAAASTSARALPSASAATTAALVKPATLPPPHVPTIATARPSMY
jgi:serine/threonine protein kinase